MIGHYLLTLTTEQEDRVLTQSFEPLMARYRVDQQSAHGYCRCLILQATNGASMFGPIWEWLQLSPGRRYEELAWRFGVARINAVIRNRILANRAQRVLGTPVESAVIGSTA